RLRVRAALHRHLAEGRRGQVDRRVQRQRRELLALRLLHRLGLLLRELAQAAQEILGIAAEWETKAAAFPAPRVTVRSHAPSCLCSPWRMPLITWRQVRCDQAIGTRQTSIPAQSESA